MDGTLYVLKTHAFAVNPSQGAAVTAVEKESDINHMEVVEGSGLFFLANESPKIATYFIPVSSA